MLFEDNMQKSRKQADVAGLDAKLVIDEDILIWYDSEKTFAETIIMPRRKEEDSLLTEVANIKQESEKRVEAGKETSFELCEVTSEIAEAGLALDRKLQIWLCTMLQQK